MSAHDPAGPAVIVDPFSSGAEYAPAFTAAGVPVVGVLSRPTPPAVYLRSYRPAAFSQILGIEDGVGALIQRLARLRPRCILPGADSGVELADLLAAHIIPEPDHSNVAHLANARRHKGAMMDALQQAGVPVLRQICSDDVEAVAAWLDATGLSGKDIVIKPPKSASTDGVTRVRGGDDWRSVYLAQLGAVNQWGNVNETMVVQEYAVGDEYVVDTFSGGGIHSVANICRYQKMRSGTHVGIYQSMEWIPHDAAVADTLCRYARCSLDAVGITTGASHTEIMVTTAGPRLIEINARPHGGGHPIYCRAATGDSQVDRAVRYLTSADPLPADYRLRQQARVVFLISPSAGIMTNIETLDPVRQLPSFFAMQLQVGNGSWVAATGDLLTTQAFGFVVIMHPTLDQVTRDCMTIRALEKELILEPGNAR
jgi:hypothetical protein